MSQGLLEEVSDWKLEAKLESSDRYFFHTRIVDRLTSGKKSYVIGRKGTGKTAIAEFICSTEDDTAFVQKLTFKNFPFNVLYELGDKGYTSPNQYITLWKYLIYTTICKMLSKNMAVDVESREELSRLFEENLTTALPKAVEKWTGFNFDVKVLGSGIGVGANKERPDNRTSIGDRVIYLENYIQQRIGAETYTILFDELDEDYKNIMERTNYDKYTELLTSLFKAVQDIRAVFRDRRVFPIVFLRDDIYDLLQDPDKTKWTDYKVELDWNSDSLKNLLAFRISRAYQPKGATESFQNAWSWLFTNDQVTYGHRANKSMTAFEYITRCTQNRPRDYVRYIQICADQALEQNLSKISAEIVKSESHAFSNYLKSELEDEIHGAIPEIKQIFSLFTKMRKQTFSINEFKDLYLSEVEAGNIPKRDHQFILQMLFMFSVVGNVPSQSNHHIFRYKNKESRLNMHEGLVIHRGLFAALEIF